MWSCVALALVFVVGGNVLGVLGAVKGITGFVVTGMVANLAAGCCVLVGGAVAFVMASVVLADVSERVR